MERSPDRDIDTIEGMPVGIQWKGNSGRECREANNIGTTLDEYSELAGDATQGDSAQHHDMRWDECSIASDKRVPLNIPAGAFKKNDGAKQSSQPQYQAQRRDGPKRACQRG